MAKKPKTPKTAEEIAARDALKAARRAQAEADRAQLKRMNKKPRCVECQSWNVHMTTGAEIYPHRPDLHDLQYWRCECGAYIGCRKGSDYSPNGRPAHGPTRKAREAAMALLEPIWIAAAARDSIHTLHARQRAYRWLAGELGVDEADGDINMMNQAQALRAAEICRPFVKKRGQRTSPGALL